MDFDKIKKEKKRYFSMSLEEKRKEYKCKNNFKTLDVITPWSQYSRVNNIEKMSSDYKFKPKFNEKVSIFFGDITTLEIDAIVNSANKVFVQGKNGTVEGAIHAAAGPSLELEWDHLNGCYVGNSKITGGYKLPAKFVIHTVGPDGENPSQLQSCYQTSLELFRQNELKSIAFPCISTANNNYPDEKAAEIALTTVRHWLDISRAINKIDRIIFCLLLQKDVDIYHKLMPKYFPLK